MNFWIGVVFFCLPGDCSFWKAEQVFDTKAECEETVSGALDVFERNTDVAAGACLEVKLVKA